MGLLENAPSIALGLATIMTTPPVVYRVTGRILSSETMFAHYTEKYRKGHPLIFRLGPSFQLTGVREQRQYKEGIVGIPQPLPPSATEYHIRGEFSDGSSLELEIDANQMFQLDRWLGARDALRKRWPDRYAELNEELGLDDQ